MKKIKNKIDEPVADINITIKDFDDFYSRYSMEGSEVIAPELVDFIAKNNDFNNKNTKLNINFHIDAPLNDVKMANIRHTIQRQYTQEKNSLKIESKRQLMWGMLCFALGIIFALILIFQNIYIDYMPFAVFIEIFAWALTWESIGRIFMWSQGLIVHRRKCERVLNAKINFLNK